jgi:pSer/pThr/pTyr-binding forkhead associated (FHA) protein
MPTDATATGGAGPLWVDGEFWLRIQEAGGQGIVHVPRPHALIGRLEGADVRIADRSVSARHVYLHLDSRGLYAVDLSTRTGTRFPASGQLATWLAPGQMMEVGGRRIQFVDFRIREDRSQLDPARARADLLAAADDAALVRVMLYPLPAHDSPRSLESELVFAGRGATCGVRVEGASASRVHAALFRTRHVVYVVDLHGRGTSINDRLVVGGSPLADGDLLGLGAARFEVRLTPAADLGVTAALQPLSPDRGSPPSLRNSPLAGPPATIEPVRPPAANFPLGPPDILAATDLQSTNLAAVVLQLVQAGQAETLRRQDEFQMNLVRLVHQMQLDNATVLSEHLKRMEAINQELATLRDEIRRRLGPVANLMPSLPDVPPLRVVPSTAPANPEAATDWLLNRVSQLEEENRSTWKEILGRLTNITR